MGSKLDNMKPKDIWGLYSPNKLSMKNLIGPHEGIEFELLESGEKNVAYFYELIPEKYYVFKKKNSYKYIEFQKEILIKNNLIKMPYVIIFRKSYDKEALRLHDILLNKAAVRNMDAEREIGQILSYPEEAIEHYLNVNYR